MLEICEELKEYFYDIVNYRRIRLIKAGIEPEVVEEIIKLKMGDLYRKPL